MKLLTNLHLSLLALALGGVSASAAPLVSLGEETALFINSSAGVEHNTNIFRRDNDREADTAFFVRPGLEVVYGDQGAPASARLLVGWEFRRHDEFDQLDDEFAKVDFDTKYDSGVSLLTGNASYNQYGTSSRTDDPSDTTDELVPVNAERTETEMGGNMKYRVSDRLALGGGLQFLGREYGSGPGGQSLIDMDRFELPLRVFYNIAPKLDAVAGFRHRRVNVGESPSGGVQAPDYSDGYLFLGLDGEIFNPLWTIALDVGYQEREYQNSPIDRINSISTSGRITYAADANRSYYLLILRDYSVSPVGAETFLKNQITLGGNFRLSEVWSTLFAVNYAQTDYDTSDRKEDLIFLLGGLTYSPNDYLSISGRVRLTSVDGSGTSATEYENEFVSVSASVRY